MASKGKAEKQFKIAVRQDKNPELYKWVQALPYGAFPKIVLETLEWMNEKGLLVKGGVNSPELLFQVLNKPAPVISSPDLSIQNEILTKVHVIIDLLNQGNVARSNELNNSTQPDQTLDTTNTESTEMPAAANEIIEDDLAPRSPFKVFTKKRGKNEINS